MRQTEYPPLKSINIIPFFLAPASEYDSNDVEVGKCGYAVCLCDTELLRCFKKFQNVLNLTTYVGWTTSNPGFCPITSNISTWLREHHVFKKLAVKGKLNFTIRSWTHKIPNPARYCFIVLRIVKIGEIERVFVCREKINVFYEGETNCECA